MPNIRLTLEYNGRNFHGWQAQPEMRTVQSELTRVVEMILRRKVRGLVVAGRTDAGVHARGQVVNFFVDETESAEPIDLWRLCHSTSRVLSGEVAVLKAEIVAPEFNARRDAIAKQYTYNLLVREAPATIDHDRVWHIGTHLDLAILEEQARTVVGRHDFTSLRGNACNSKSPVRRVFESEIIRRGELIQYRVVGQGFLKHMVRNIVGTLVALSRRSLPDTTLAEVLARRLRSAAGMTAPAHALTLDRVWYEDGEGRFVSSDD